MMFPSARSVAGLPRLRLSPGVSRPPAVSRPHAVSRVPTSQHPRQPSLPYRLGPIRSTAVPEGGSFENKSSRVEGTPADATNTVGRGQASDQGSWQETVILEERPTAHQRTWTQVVATYPTPPVAKQGTDKVSLVALVLVSSLACGAFLYGLFQKLFIKKAGGLVDVTANVVSQANQQKKIQKEAMERLDELAERLKTWSSVNFAGKQLGDEGTAYVVEALAFSSSCAALDLSRNGIGKMGVAQVCEVLNICALTNLSLSTNSVGDEGAEALAKKLSGNVVLRTLNLGQNGISDRGATALAEALRINTTLTKLDLSGNGIEVNGAKALASALIENQTLQSLSLCDNYLDEDGAKALAEMLVKNNSITELNLKGNNIGDEGMKEICEALMARNADIVLLDFGNNNMGPAAAEALARLLAMKQGIRELSVYFNEIGSEGITKIITAVNSGRNLRCLDLSGTHLTAQDAKALAELKGHPELTQLHLANNPLGAEGAKEVALLCTNGLKKLEVLKLGWCKIGLNGAVAMSELLLYNNTLTSLDLSGNNLGDEGCRLLASALKEHDNKKLVELDLGWNEIGDKGAYALAQAMKANPGAAPTQLRLGSNYIHTPGQVALRDGVDQVYDMADRRKVEITY